MANNVKEDNNKILDREQDHHPWLMINHGNWLQIQTYYSISKDKYLINMIPDLRNKLVSQASYGWLLLVDYKTLDCCLMNPKTKEIIHLPQLAQRAHYRCTLTKPPTEPDCHILLMGSSNILFCRVGEDTFTQRPKSIDGGYMMSAVNFQGKIYAWMSEKRGFVTVDFRNADIVLKDLVKKDGQPCQIPCGRLSPSDAPISVNHLIESCGEILLVHVICCSSDRGEVSHFRIFKIDMVEIECKELHSIGDRTIFLCRSGGMAMLHSSKETTVEKDSIYYFNPFRSGKTLYVYHIRDRCHTPLLPFRRVRADSFKSWIMI